MEHIRDAKMMVHKRNNIQNHNVSDCEGDYS